MISIIVPLYKSENFIHQAVDSLVNQTYRDLEIILVNDGSPDSSGVIADQYAIKDARVKVIHQTNQGAAAALNNGIKISAGDYLMFLDGDDWLNLNTCQEAMQIANDQNVDLVFWPFIKEFENYSKPENNIFNEDQKFIKEDLVWLKRRVVGLVGEELSIPTRTDAINSAWGKLYKSSLIKNQVKWTDTNTVGSSDVIFNIEVFQHLSTAYYMHKFYTHYRKSNPHALTRNYSTSLLPKYLNLFKATEEIITERGLSINYVEALNNRICVSTINHALNITGGNHDLKFTDQLDYFREVLNHPVYKNAFKTFRFDFLKLHWKVFFLLCKQRQTVLVLFLSYIMKRLR